MNMGFQSQLELLSARLLVILGVVLLHHCSALVNPDPDSLDRRDGDTMDAPVEPDSLDPIGGDAGDGHEEPDIVEGSLDTVDVSDRLTDLLEDDTITEVEAPEEIEYPDVVEVPPGLIWVSIPGGIFDMGCVPGDEWCESEELPRHEVTVSAFEMTQTEITQAQYEAVTEETPSDHAECAECPVEQVDWYQAKAFCEAIGGRLPSEAEWEYAARAGTTNIYTCGDAPSCLEAVAWYSENSSATHPVGEKPANAFGLYDIIGNVWEWVEDCLHENYDGAPSTGGVWTEGGDCGVRVWRGGSWRSARVYLRTSYRDRANPDYSDGTGGFRCVQDAT